MLSHIICKVHRQYLKRLHLKHLRDVGLILCSIQIAACSTAPVSSDNGSTSAQSSGQNSAAPQTDRDDAVNTDTVTLSSELAKSSRFENGELYYKGQKLKNATFDLPVEMNPAVEKWIAYFTGKGRKHFERYLERSEIFIPFMKPILKNARAPEDLVYLAMIESGFNNNAKSHARAVGAWQFITWTGRRYGLDVNWWVDERRDVEKSTIAAIQYLKELNAMFGDWKLAAASYNAGEAKIQRAIKRYKTDHFWELCKFKYLKPETKNYVPKLFAAAIVSKNRAQFGFEEAYSSIKNQKGQLVAVEDAEFESLPQSLDDSGNAENISADTKAEALANMPSNVVDEDELLAEDSVEALLKDMSNPVKTPHVNKQGEVNGDVLITVEIPSPADLFKVASAAGLTYSEFKSMNPELLRWLTPPQVKSYAVRIPLSHHDEFVKKYFSENFEREVDFLTYKARKGDTVKSISKRFGINADPVSEMNRVGIHTALVPGTMVELPIPSDFVRSLTSLKSLDLLDPVYPKKHRARRSVGQSTRKSKSAPKKQEAKSKTSKGSSSSTQLNKNPFSANL